MNSKNENIKTYRFGSFISCGVTRTIRRMTSGKGMIGSAGLRIMGLGVGLGFFILVIMRSIINELFR
jgi:hypothetical protein